MTKRRIVLWLLSGAFLWVVWSRHAEITKLVDVLLQGRMRYIALAAALQLAYYVLQAGLYRASFRTVGVESRMRDLLPTVAGSIFVNVVAPLGGTSGPALFVDDAARRGQSPARAAAGTVLARLTGFGALGLALIPGLVYLSARHDLKPYQVTGAVVFAAYLAALMGLLFVGKWRPSLLHRLLEWVRWAANWAACRLRRSEFLGPDWAEKHAVEYGGAAHTIGRHPGRLARTMGTAVMLHVVSLAALYVLCLAFGERIGIHSVLATYAVGLLFWIISPTPEGVGIVEGIMTVVFTSLGVPIHKAMVITLAFRGLTFWIPFGIGFVLLHRVKSFRPERRAAA